MGRIKKTRWLLTINTFSKMGMKKSVFNIMLMDNPRLGGSQRENNRNGCWFDHETKSLIKISVGFFRKTTNYPTSLVTSKTTIGMKFMTKDTFTKDNIGNWHGTRDQVLLCSRASNYSRIAACQ